MFKFFTKINITIFMNTTDGSYNHSNKINEFIHFKFILVINLKKNDPITHMK